MAEPPRFDFRLSVVMASLWLVACSSVYEPGTEVRLGNVAVTISRIEHRHACLRSPHRRYLDGRPSLLLVLRVRNAGDAPMEYAPRHGRPVVTDTDYVNIYGADRELLRGVVYELNTLAEGQVAGPVILGPGEEVEDLFVFDVPPANVRELLVKIPAALWGQAGMLELRVNNSLPPAESLTVHEIGEVAELGSARITVRSVATTLPVFRAPEAHDWTVDPVPSLVVRWDVEAARELVYDGDRTGPATWGPALRVGDAPTGDFVLGRALLPAVVYPEGTVVAGQLAGRISLAPGERRADHALFHVPPPGTALLRMELPGSMVETACSALFRLPWKPSPPPSRADALESFGIVDSRDAPPEGGDSPATAP